MEELYDNDDLMQLSKLRAGAIWNNNDELMHWAAMRIESLEHELYVTNETAFEKMVRQHESKSRVLAAIGITAMVLVQVLVVYLMG